MKHRVKKPRLGRVGSQRKALVRSLLTSLIINGKIKTTEARAKVIASEFDELVSLVMRQSEKREQIRFAKTILFGETAQKSLFEKVLPGIVNKSGQTRMTKMGPRKGDAAEVIQVEILSYVS